ncbi:chromate transporter [Enterococcus florum]|uniref:Chromate transporter n=1 Tax=Enterococcus florum TaxID=2480627 RepID=A0A4P5P5N4_9ENTE|nr:chromate transporter [Enterococcus florum]GCF93000.1 chromate transporter [Enterococcus florum]
MSSSYVRLFGYNFFISTFTFGGGYVTIPMMEKYFVNHGDLSKEELLDLATIAQSSPGAIAVNLSVLVGKKARGYKGAFVSGVAAIMPSFVILSLISLAYSAFQNNPMVRAVLQGMEAAVAAIIVDLVIDMYFALRREKNLWLMILPFFAFVANAFFNVHPLWILILAAVFVVLQRRVANA